MNRVHGWVFVFLIPLSLASAWSAQDPTPLLPPHYSDALRGLSSLTDLRAEAPAALGSPERSSPILAAPSESANALSRWIEVQTAVAGVRYRFSETSRRVIAGRHLQYSNSFKGRIKLDPQGKYSVHAGVFAGPTFVLSWNNSGWGAGGDGIANHYLKQLYFSANPLQGLELQYGSLYFQRGESTEITGYDNDGYVMGQRLILKRPKEFFFDEMAVTYGYLGDIGKPSFHRRTHHLKRSNYHQFLVSKKINQRTVVSADYSFQSGVETLRQAVVVRAPELRVVDWVRFENYQRLDVQRDYGFAFYGEKPLWQRFVLGAGYASVDRNFGNLNSDRFNRGYRWYALGSYAIRPALTLSSFFTQTAGTHFPVPIRRRFDVVLQYNLGKSLNDWGPFKTVK